MITMFLTWNSYSRKQHFKHGGDSTLLGLAASIYRSDN